MNQSIEVSSGAARILRLEPTADLSAQAVRDEALETLERGGIVFLPDAGFDLTANEREMIGDVRTLLSRQPEVENGKPTIIFDPARGKMRRYHFQRVQGKNVSAHIRPEVRADIEAMMKRFGEWAEKLVEQLLQRYTTTLATDRVTYRPTPRNRTQGLHIDSSYGHPTQGRGMLRVFCNVHPAGRPRVWQVGEPFEAFVRRFLPSVAPRSAGWASAVLTRLGLVRGAKTPYDQMMADLRLLGMNDKEYQRTAPRSVVEFPSGSCWIAITDLVLHGAMSGQHSLDQTFFLPATGMKDPSRASRSILERLTGRALM